MKSELLSQTKNQDNPKYRLATSLAHLLADTYLLELKTQNFHWNIEGPQFYHLHLLLETQYQDLQTAGDLIAERIRTLGFYAPGSYAEFTQLSQIKESVSVSLDSTQMLQALLVDNENVALSLKKFSAQASELNDPSTVSLIDERAAIHEKTSWMLRSLTAK